MDIITYSLGKDCQGQYYRDVSGLADETLRRGSHLKPVAKGYRQWLIDHQLENGEVEEYLYELLTLGVYLQRYGKRLMPGASARWLLRLSGQLRVTRKNMANGLRAALNGLYLYRERKLPARGADSIAKLTQWLQVTGSFEHEAIRLSRLGSFLETLSELDIVLEQVDSYARWFNARAQEVLGCYTPGVAEFNCQQSKFREDALETKRSPAEYHLNMVGAEILNRAYWDRFFGAPRRVVLVPCCMRLKGEQCPAARTDYGFSCSSCSKDCPVYRLTNELEGIEAYIIPHQSEAFARWSTSSGENSNLAVVGITCVATLIAGGWKARNIGVPAQCVLLNYCGCKSHWHKQGITTEINQAELKKILEQ